jgi:hypothetical protein
VDDVFIFLIIALSVAAGVAWIWPSAWFLKHVDLAYYPLAAVGAALLYISTETQRERVGAAEEAAVARTQLERVRTEAPKISEIRTSADLEKGLEGLRSIVGRADGCKNAIMKDFRCDVAIALAPIFKAHLVADSRSQNESTEVRYAQWCLESVQLLDQVGLAKDLPHQLQDGLRVYFDEGLKRGFKPSDQQGIETFVSGYVIDAMDRLEPILGGASNNIPGIVLLRGNYMAQIEAHQAALRSVSSCLWTPLDQLRQILSWDKHRLAAEQKATAAAERLKEIQGRDTDSSLSGFIRLSIWPFVLIVALALKFAKAAGGLYVERGWRR